MEKFSTILLLAGSSVRCELGYNKVLHLINEKPVFMYSLEKFLDSDYCSNIVIVCKDTEKSDILKYISNEYLEKIDFVSGGASRQESVLNGLKRAKEEYVLIHDGARPLISVADIEKVFFELKRSHLTTLATITHESIRYIDEKENKVLDRNKVYSIKTPQGVMKSNLVYALERAKDENISFYDDVSAVEKYCNLSAKIIISSNKNIKITEYEDIKMVESILGKRERYLIGHSHDTHRLDSGDFIIIGGEKIECQFSIVAHSDGDVLYHSIAEAVIGALGKGDLGTWFSDKDPKYKDISSDYFMIEVEKMLEKSGYEIVNIDSTIFIETPMMGKYIPNMRKNIAKLLKTDIDRINVKATRGEKVGPIGESKAVSSETILLLKNK